MLSSDYKNYNAYLNNSVEYNNEINKSIDDFVSQFQTKATRTYNKTLDFQNHYVKPIRDLMITELEQAKKKLGDIQDLVISNLTGSTSNRSNTDEFEKHVENKIGELEYNVNAARELVSRFNHRCDRCEKRKPLSASSSQGLAQSQLDSLILCDAEQALDSESEPKYNEKEAGRRLQTLCRSNSCNVQTEPVSLSFSSSPTPKEIPVNIKSIVPSQSSTVFRRSSSLIRLAPLKLRPTLKHSTQLSRSKNLGNRAGDEGESLATSLPIKNVSKNISNCNPSITVNFTQNDSRKLPSLRPLKAYR
ncbi:unnamed protein product [Hymenolepis diminuta]|uniref:Uncharacterized protein n=1 Tax=Hymenolepis diminuta TaxID=6216 RepID=A0A564YI96_HYMDI|nr:unnamed protein product [Hymenolepis diminuta]